MLSEIERIEAAAPPVERMQMEPVRLDLAALAIQMGGDMDLIAGARAARAIGSRCDRKYQSSVTR